MAPPPTRVAPWALILLASAGCGGSGGGAPRCDPPPDGEPQVTLLSLLADMATLEAPTRWPDPPFVAAQSTSFDRRSTTPEDAEGWFANRDRGQFERTVTVDGRTEFVLFDGEGPGAVMRLWSANPQGVLRIYVDCDGAPVVEAPMADLLSGRVAPFGSPFGYGVTPNGEGGFGANLYFPFPYQSHIRITTDRGVTDMSTGAEDLYYHVGYRTYREGTVVRSFSRAELEAAAGERARVAALLEAPDGPPEGDVEALTIDSAGDTWTHTLTAPSGGAAITELTLSAPDADPDVLRGAVLHLTFDGVETVRTPVGDFFGTAPGRAPYESLPMSVRDDGTLVSRWVMPFAEEATLSVSTAVGASLSATGTVRVRARPWDPDSLLFHARFRATGRTVASLQDLPLANLSGRGLLVGTLFTITHPSECWWGEGDERIYVDDEPFPSHFGTGTEDYFGYAWAQDQTFARPYHAQTRYDSGQGNRGCGRGENLGGVASMNRWHVPDPIPFERALRFDMEVWHWDPESPVAVETVTYYYANAGSSDDFPALEAGDARVISVLELSQ